MNSLVNYTKAIAASAWMNSFATHGEFRELKEATALVIANALTPQTCRELISRIDSIADDPSHPRVWRDGLASDTRILGFEQDMVDLVRFFDVPRRIAAIDAYTGRKTKSWTLMANRVVQKENNLGSGGGLHRDSPFSHQVKCIWYLNDVTGENGPFQYVPGTHFNLLGKREIYPLGQSRFERVEDELLEVHAKAGSLLVCDTKCIHGGKPIKSGKRYAVTLYTLPKVDGVATLFKGSGIDPQLAVRAKAG